MVQQLKLIARRTPCFFYHRWKTFTLTSKKKAYKLIKYLHAQKLISGDEAISATVEVSKVPDKLLPTV